MNFWKWLTGWTQMRRTPVVGWGWRWCPNAGGGCCRSSLGGITTNEEWSTTEGFVYIPEFPPMLRRRRRRGACVPNHLRYCLSAYDGRYHSCRRNTCWTTEKKTCTTHFRNLQKSFQDNCNLLLLSQSHSYTQVFTFYFLDFLDEYLLCISRQRNRLFVCIVIARTNICIILCYIANFWHRNDSSKVFYLWLSSTTLFRICLMRL